MDVRSLKFLCAFAFRPKKFGYLWVGSGKQEIKIHTDLTPGEVFINLGQPRHSYGCGNGQDRFDTKIVDGGFIIVCDVTSTRRRIKWLALK